MEVVRRLLPGPNVLAGLVDAAVSSLATFVVGVYAVRTLEPVVLGGYSLVYQLVFLAAIVPAAFVFGPVESEVVDDPAPARMAHVRRSLRLGSGPALGAGLLVALWPRVAPGELPVGPAVALATTGAAVAVLSPIQDHVRRMLHSAGRSRQAAVASLVQLLVVAIGLLAAAGMSLPAAALPFGILAAANLVSLAVAIAPHLRHAPPSRPLRLTAVARRGGWLVAGSLLGPAAGFVAASIVAAMAGAEALGHAEAARIIAQPVWVLAVGLSAALSPRLMSARRRGNVPGAVRLRRRFLAAVLAVGAVIMLWFGIAWIGNPLPGLLRPAYVVPGLVVLSVLAQTLTAAAFPYRSELLGLNHERKLLRLEVAASAARIIPSAAAGLVGALAVPMGLACAGAVRVIGSALALRRRNGDLDQAPAEAWSGDSVVS